MAHCVDMCIWRMVCCGSQPSSSSFDERTCCLAACFLAMCGSESEDRSLPLEKREDSVCVSVCMCFCVCVCV